MKQNIKNILLSAAVMLSMAGCSEYLDKSPLSDIEENDPYKNFRNFQGFTEELYSCIPVMTSQDYHNAWNFGEDEIWEPNDTRPLTYSFDQGDYWAWQTAAYGYLKTGAPETTGNDRFKKGHLYGMCWHGIRKANTGIAHLADLTDATQEERDLIEGQLYFFRGWFHFMLMQFWGGLPYIDRELPAGEAFQYERLSYQETAEKAAEDLQHAADLLPVDWDQTTAGKTTLGKNAIRINKIMALAYLGKDLLWAGSPLMNKESTGSESYNADFCKRAADAFGQVLSLCDQTGRYALADFENYRDIFYTWKSGVMNGLKEAIFYENINTDWRWNQVNDYRPTAINGGGVKCFPTANYADYFGMANGLPIADANSKDPESGYDPEYPFRNRDPRFYNNFIFDAVKCVKDASKCGNDPYKQYASLFNGENNKYCEGTKGCFTGYLNMKFTDQYMNDWDGYKDNNILVMPILRLADVYLMYAEAAANAAGSPAATSSNYSMTALQAVNKIRNRAGIPDMAEKYSGSMDGFMSELRRERAVELAFEGHRFHDLRRWLLLDKKPYNQKCVITFQRAADMSDADRYADPANAHIVNFKETVYLTRNFSEKHYWLPLPKDDVNMYSGYKQNPGWE